MNVHGFWSKANAKNRKDRSVLKTEPTPPPGRYSPSEAPEGTWRDHSDRVAVERAEVAKCQLSKVSQ